MLKSEHKSGAEPDRGSSLPPQLLSETLWFLSYHLLMSSVENAGLGPSVMSEQHKAPIKQEDPQCALGQRGQNLRVLILWKVALMPGRTRDGE